MVRSASVAHAHERRVECAREPRGAERAYERRPSNLIRVMPAKGANRMVASDVIVVGAGAIGTAIAWRCAQRGLAVTVVDPDPLRGAWHTAAGMLAPITELHYTETPLLRLNLDSLARYPDFAAEVEAESGLPTGYASCGALLAAW